jgi:cell division protein FtsB
LASQTRRVVVIAVAVAAGAFAVQGGEYSTLDLIRQRSRRALLRAEIDTLERQVDSLNRLTHAVETDPAVQERIAREQFGLVRGTKELLYRFAPSPGAR